MGVRWENDCVCCADGCHGCGRDRDYPVRFCDSCGVALDEDTRIFRYNMQDFCGECLLDILVKEGKIEEMTEDM